MNLVIDIGNTLIKIGVFNDATIVYKTTLQHADFEETIQSLKKGHPQITDLIVSSVSNFQNEFIDFLSSNFKTVVLDHLVPMPFKNVYKTPNTLGIDRLALVAAAVQQYPKKNVLVIDAGTCITYDFKNKKEEYLGGAIAPGLRLRYQCLHDYTAKLPLLEITEPSNLTGTTTHEAIHSGVVYGVLNEIDGLITDYCNIYPDLTVILTGGDAHFLSKRLKNSIFATSNFLLEGLNYILDFNNSR